MAALLPHQSGRVYLTDGGLETCLIYDRHHDLPEFASFPLLSDKAGRASLVAYYREYADLAAELGRGLVLATPSYRASERWGRRLGYSPDQVDRLLFLSLSVGKGT